MEEVLPKLLDWPFLFTLCFIVLLFTFKADIKHLFTRGRISLTWGDKNFEVSDLPEELDENFAPIADDIEDLKQRIALLESGQTARSGPGTPRSPAPAMNSDPAKDEKDPNTATKDRMLQALTSSQYTWRNIDRLASIGGVTNEKAEEILRPLNEIIFSRNKKTGRAIVKIKDS